MALRTGRLAIVGILLLAIAAAGALLVRRALGGGSVRSAVEARLTTLLGQPFRIRGLSLAIFPRPAITGTDVTVGQSGVTAPSLAVDHITIIPSVRSLLRGPVVLEDVRLEGFVVAVLRDRTGAWHVPAAVPAPTPEGQDGLIVRHVGVVNGRLRAFEEQSGGGVVERSSIDRLEAGIVSTGAGLRLSPITGRIGTSAISGEASTDDSTVHLEFSADTIGDADLPAFAGLIGAARPEGFTLNAPAAASLALTIDRRSSKLSGTGKVSALDLTLAGLRLQQFTSPFTLAGSHLSLDATEFALYGGTHRGSIVVDFAAAPRWSLDSRVSHVDTGRFLAALAGSDVRVDGTASGSARLAGRLDGGLWETLTGTARLEIADGVIREFPLLAAINRAVRLTEGDARNTRFQRLSATLALGHGRAATDDLVLEAGQVRVEAAGTIGFDRSLALHGKAVLAPERAAEAIRSVRELSGLRNSRGEIEMPLTISGTLDAPSFGLDLKSIIGKGIEDELKRRLRGLFGR